MSFKDTFTRDSSSNENLQYDDAAAYHFYLTMLLLITIPLIYSIFKSVLNPFGHIPDLKDIENKSQFKQRIRKFKKEYRYNYVTKGFILKIVITCFLVFAIIHSYKVLSESENKMKGFDPYEILEVDTDAPIQKIKKSYRKLALKYHPDRNQDDPQANAKFIMISKAYQCLTNEEAKQNCLKYGNPEGSTAFNVGIALPSFLVKKENHVVIMGIIFLLIVIVIPIGVVYYQSEINKYDDHGMLLQNHAAIHTFLNQHYSIKDCIKTVPLCTQFKGFKSNPKKEECYRQLLSKCSQQVRKTIEKKKFLPFINKAMLIIDARLNEEKISPLLQQDQKFILKKVPVLTRAIIMIAWQRSTQEFKYFYRNEKFVGADAIESIIKFGQLFVQGLALQSESFEQLCLLPEQTQKIFKKKKQRKITSLKNLQQSSEDRQFLLSLTNIQRRKQIEERLDFFPKVEMQVIVHTAGEKDLTTMDIIECIIEIKANRKKSFCSAYNYPFLKVEGWWIVVSQNNTVLYLQHFNFEKDTFQVKFNRRPHSQLGSKCLKISLMSDCYIGLDIEKQKKYEIKQVQKTKQSVETESESAVEDEQGSLFSRWMNSIMPKEQEELSDKEDQDTTQNKDTRKQQSKEAKEVKQMKRETDNQQ